MRKKLTKIFKMMNKNENVNEQEVNEVKDEKQVNTEETTTSENTENNSADGKIKELEAKLAEEKDRFLRLYSEFDNAKKRNLRERSELIKSAGEDMLKLVLPVIDDFERAIKSNETTEDITAVKEGFNLIYNKMKNSFTAKGLEEMQCVGEAFDADKMEALANIPAPSEDMKGKVIEVMEKGYLLNGKVIRFAKVIVGA